MENLLKKVMDEKLLCGIYSDIENTKKFSVGFISGLDEDFYLLDGVDEYGMSDGYLCNSIDNIFKIEVKSYYIDKIQKLFNFHKQNNKQITCEDAVIDTLIKYAINYNKICSIELCKSGNIDAIGLVKSFNNGIVLIYAINESGYFDGDIYINVDNISFISCDSRDEKVLQELWNLNTILDGGKPTRAKARNPVSK